jgi:LysR family transcriptional regulator for metE and metH
MFKPKLEIRHLRMLQAMARTSSVTKAAATLGLTQSALSHQIHEAERRLGVELFVQRNKRMQMTPAAASLNVEAGRILDQLEASERSVGALGANLRHTVRVGCGAYSCYRWLPRVLKGFQAGAADIDIEVVADATQRPLKALLDRNVDVAMISATPDKASTRSLRLFRDELMLIMPPGHTLAARRFVGPEDLVDQVYISCSDAPEKGNDYESFIRPAQANCKKMLKVELTEAVIELVIGGFGVGILSRWAVGHYLAAGTLTAAKISRKGLFVDWHAATRKSEPLDSPAWRLATALRDWCENDPEGFALGSNAIATELRAAG